MPNEKLEESIKILKNQNSDTFTHDKLKSLLKEKAELEDIELEYVIEILLNREIITIKSFGGSEGEIYEITES